MMGNARAASRGYKIHWREGSRCTHRAQGRGGREGAILQGGGAGQRGAARTKNIQRGKHTQNMKPMSVTWEVSQLRGWSKASALCRGSHKPRAHGAGRAAGREAAGGG